MDISSRSRIYGAAGASLVAAAVAGRYVAKWRRHRTIRQGSGDRQVGGGRCYIGLDLADPNAKSPRPADLAVLDGDLHCTFANWTYREDGTGIIPTKAIGRSFILAVDGPQGLAGFPGATVRESEKAVNAPGRSPYELPEPGKPYAGFITGSVRLFHHLVNSGSRFRLLGLDGVTARDANLLEVYPGGAWRDLSETPLPPKRTIDGRQARFDLLRRLGVEFDTAAAPTTDQLDAAMAAWVALRFDMGGARVEGLPPVRDEAARVLREGYVVRPGALAADVPPDVVAPV